MKRHKGHLVREVAQLARISVRTLHYYDLVGLLRPSGRTAASYRMYSDADLLRLQQIMLSRMLGFSLEEIKRSLDDPKFDAIASLYKQRALLVRRLEETHRVIASVDAALAQLQGAAKDEPMEMKTIFDGFDPKEFTSEAETRWGQMDAYLESTRRTRKYSETDWRAIKAEEGRI